MSGLVLELQRDALDASTSVAVLLRKASVVSRKLGLKDVDDWVALELGGYAAQIGPEYRKVVGSVMYQNPYNGWQPVVFGDEKTTRNLSTRYMSQSVAELEDLLRSDSKKFVVRFPNAEEQWLMSEIGLGLQPVLHVPRQALVKILAAVRDKLLHWSLDLESRGILGEGLTFSKEERIVARQITYNTTTNIGEMHHSQVQQHSSGLQTFNASDVKDLPGLLEAVASAINKIGLQTDQKRELEAELATLKAQLTSPRPKSGILREGLRSVKTILEGAAGNVLASDLLQRITPLLANLSA